MANEQLEIAPCLAANRNPQQAHHTDDRETRGNRLLQTNDR